MAKEDKTSNANAHQVPALFGTFQGVYIPSVLTILGVIMYLRMGWVVGNVGLTGALVIVTLSSAITFLTGLSISATATNMRVGGGGAYYMVSRSFGPEAGAAIGIPLFLAQALGISFYLAGFAESIQSLIPWISTRIVGSVSLLVLMALAYRKPDLALKAQLVIFAIILLSLMSFAMGVSPEGGFAEPINPPPVESFWHVFAVFFPAVTGILAGISMSGDLKNPGKSLPFGTLAAIATGFVIYISLPIALNQVASEEVLRANLMIMQQVAFFGVFILLGIWGATLSSALGSLLAAPRTLQALGRDRVVPHFVAQSGNDDGVPRVATAISFGVALIGIWLGDLDKIAPVLSMFFLTAYGFLNLIAGLEGLIGNPSWRPKFRVPWVLSLVGAGACFATMFMINPGATLLAAFLQISVFLVMQKREFNERWSDTRFSLLTTLARFTIYRLAGYKTNAKSWRPNILVLSGSPTARFYLIELADAITHGKSFLTVASILPQDSVGGHRVESLEKSIEDFLKKRSIPSLVKVQVASDVMAGAESLVRSYGLGPLVPNTFVLGETEKEENFFLFSKLICLIGETKRNVLVVREGEMEKRGLRRRIDVWWGGLEQNGGLMLALAYMLQTSPEWRGAELALKCAVRTEKDRSNAMQTLGNLLDQGRIDAELGIYVVPEGQDALSTTIKEVSQNADFVFLGLRQPSPEESVDAYAEYYKNLLRRTSGFPPTGLVLGHEAVRFRDIFGESRNKAA